MTHKTLSVGIIGAITLDEIAHVKQRIEPQDSNQAVFSKSLGGVGANIARNLHKLAHKVTLITAFNPLDLEGQFIQAKLTEEKLNIHLIPSQQTAKFIAFMDHNQDLYVGMNDMQAFEKAMNKAALSTIKPILDGFDILLIDANFTGVTLQYIVKAFKGPIYAEAISANKVLRLKPILPYLKGIKLNLKESQSLFDDPTLTAKAAVLKLKNLGLNDVIVTSGEQGAFIADQDQSAMYKPKKSKHVNTLGAGDAFFAGYLHGVLTNQDKINNAFSLAQIALESNESVSKVLNLDYFKKRCEEYHYVRKNRD